MKFYFPFKIILILLFVTFIGMSTLFSEVEKEGTHFYLGVLADGYPNSLVVSEFKYANARIVSIDEKMVLFGITDKTKPTTFFKKLPFLKGIYIDEQDIKGDSLLRTSPLGRKFLLLLQKNRNLKVAPPQSKMNLPQEEASMKSDVRNSFANETNLEKGNMILIDRLIREKAKEIRNLGKIKGKQKK